LGKGRQRHFGVLNPRVFAVGDAGLRGAKVDAVKNYTDVGLVLDEGVIARRTREQWAPPERGVEVKLLRMKHYKGPKADSIYTRSGEETLSTSSIYSID
jgi:hypothetical protein